MFIPERPSHSLLLAINCITGKQQLLEHEEAEGRRGLKAPRLARNARCEQPFHNRFHLLLYSNQQQHLSTYLAEWLNENLRSYRRLCDMLKWWRRLSACREEQHFPLGCAGSVSLDLIQYAKALWEIRQPVGCVCHGNAALNEKHDYEEDNWEHTEYETIYLSIYLPTYTPSLLSSTLSLSHNLQNSY